MDPVIARLSKSSDPTDIGRRIRSARKGRGLTLQALADGIISTAFLSRVETGKRRAEVGVLAELAERLGLSVGDLLGVSPSSATGPSAGEGLQLELDYAELALASGDICDADLRLQRLSISRPAAANPSVARRLIRLSAGAHEAKAELDQAIADLERLTAGEPRDLAWIRDLISLSRCLRDAGQLARAVEVGNRAVELIAEANLAGTTEAVQLKLTVAAALGFAGQLDQAIELARTATGEAEQIDSPQALASAYWNTSIFESNRGNHDEALVLATKALAEFERGDDARNVGRLRSQLGELMLRVEPPLVDEAMDTFTIARRELEWSSAGCVEVALTDLSIARTLLRAGRVEDARAQISAPMAVLSEETPIALANGLVLAGQIAYASADLDHAQRSYARAVALLTGVGNDRGASELWYELGTLMEEVGDASGALSAYRSAAAAAGAAGRPRVTAPRGAATTIRD